VGNIHRIISITANVCDFYQLIFDSSLCLSVTTTCNTTKEISMSKDEDRQEIVKIYRKKSSPEEVIIEVVGQPALAMKQMSSPTWLVETPPRPKGD
jgi:hypothetical protein